MCVSIEVVVVVVIVVVVANMLILAISIELFEMLAFVMEVVESIACVALVGWIKSILLLSLTEEAWEVIDGWVLVALNATAGMVDARSEKKRY